MAEDETKPDIFEAPTAEEVVEKTHNLKPFIPEPLMELHQMPATDPDGDKPWKFIRRDNKGATGPEIPESFSVNSGTDVKGTSVNMRTYSHRTG